MAFAKRQGHEGLGGWNDFTHIDDSPLGPVSRSRSALSAVWLSQHALSHRASLCISLPRLRLILFSPGVSARSFGTASYSIRCRPVGITRRSCRWRTSSDALQHRALFQSITYLSLVGPGQRPMVITGLELPRHFLSVTFCQFRAQRACNGLLGFWSPLSA